MNRPLRVLVNGMETEQISVLDRGLHYGDGVFRTLRVTRGQPDNFLRQFERLQEDARRIFLEVEEGGSLEEEVARICAGHSHAVLKIILTRGLAANRGYLAKTTEASRILLLYPAPHYPSGYWHNGIRARICETRLAHNSQLAGIKHLNRLEQVLARAEWSDSQVAEGLMLDIEERLIEGVSSNLFLVKGQELLTPDLTRCGVMGVTRQMLLEAAPTYNNVVSIRDITLDDLRAADECFVCNSIIGIWPIAQLNELRWNVGPVTRKFMQYLGDPCQPAS